MCRKYLIAKSSLILLVLLVTFKTSVCQQKSTQKKAAVSINDSVKRANITRDANIMMKATIESDFSTLTKYTYPIVVKMMGGAEKMIKAISKGAETMKAQGAALKGGEIGEPGKILNTGGKLYSVVPEKIIMESYGTKFHSTSSLLAISLDKGANWYFIEGGNMTDAQIKQLVPEILGKLSIPKRSEPVVIKD